MAEAPRSKRGTERKFLGTVYGATGKPFKTALIVARRYVAGNYENETKHTVDAERRFSFILVAHEMAREGMRVAVTAETRVTALPNAERATAYYFRSGRREGIRRTGHYI